MPANANPAVADKRWLARRYAQDRATVARVAAEAGCDPATVHRALRRHGIALRGPVGREHWDDVLTPRRLRAAAKRGETHLDVAHRYGAPPRIVHDHMLRLGLLDAPGDEELARLYGAGESLVALAAAAGASTRTVARRLRGSGVALRPVGPPIASGRARQVLTQPPLIFPVRRTRVDSAPTAAEPSPISVSGTVRRA